MAKPRVIRRRQRLAGVGLLGIAVFVVALVALHVVAYRHMPSHMSQFANTRFGVFWLLAIYSFIAGTSMLVWALKPCLQDGASKRAGLAMLWLAWFGAVLLATFPADAFRPVTLRGTIHDDAALTTFVLLGAAMVVLTPAFRDTPKLARFASVSFVLGLLVTVSWIVYLAATVQQITGRGPAQRVLVLLIVAWFTLLAFRLRQGGGMELPVSQGSASARASTPPAGRSTPRSAARRAATNRSPLLPMKPLSRAVHLAPIRRKPVTAHSAA